MAGRSKIRVVAKSFKEAFRGFSGDKITKLSASLSYYTIFSLAPLLLVMIFIAGIFLGHEAAQGSVFRQLNDLVGSTAAKQIQDIISNASLSGKSGVALTIGIITLLIGATTVFGEIQDSMNGIWGLKPRPKAGIMKLISTRLISFGMIGALGFLLLVSLVATTVVEGIGNRLKEYLADVAVVVFYIVNLVLNLAVTAFLFAIIFKVLPDAKIKWRNIWPGAIATSLLFLIGKFGISLYISKSNFESTFGAAGSLVILLVWVYYSAIILYFGAEFTKAYALNSGADIVPDAYATWYEDSVVAGAHSQSHKNENIQSPQFHRQARLITFANDPILPMKKKKPSGFGRVLIGLILYMLKSPEKQKA